MRFGEGDDLVAALAVGCADKHGRIHVQPHKIERAANRGHFLGRKLRSVIPLGCEIALWIGPFHDGGQKFPVQLPIRFPRRIDVRRSLHDWAGMLRVLGYADPNRLSRGLSQRLHREAVRQHSMMAHLIALTAGKLFARCERVELAPNRVTLVRETEKLVHGEKVRQPV